MKKVFRFASLLVVGGLLITSCGKKTEETTAATTPATPVVTPSSDLVCLTSKKTIFVEVDASTKAGAKGFEKAYSCAASTTDTIYLSIKAQGTVDKMYMKLTTETGAINLFNLGTVPNVTKTVDGKAVTTGSTDYSFQLPNEAKDYYKNNALRIKIPVTKRSGAKYDIYTFWITSKLGDFDNYNKNNTFGPITVTLTYGTDKPMVSSLASIKLGDQDAVEPSYLTSSPSGVSSLSGAKVFSGTDTDAEKTATLNAVDVNFATLNATGTSCATKTTPYFISVGSRKTISGTDDCLSNTLGTNITKFAKFTLPSGKTFQALTADDIMALPTPTADKIMVENDSYYVYVTADGRKGVLKASGLTAGPKATVLVDVKVVVQ